jgi:hypothetical protein
MALPPWSHYLSKTQAAHPQWQNPKEACQGAASQVCRMPIWRNDQASLARQGNQGQPQGICHNQTWKVRLGGSKDVGFYAQLKVKLTKKHYKCATVFVNHFSHLQFVHLQLDDKSTKHSPLSLPLSSTLQSTESRSSINTGTTDVFRTTPSNKHAPTQGSNSPLVGSRPTFKIASPSKPSVTSQKVHGSNCSMRAPAGWRWSTLLCGHMPCGMPPTFTTTYQCWRMAHLGWSFSAQFE